MPDIRVGAKHLFEKQYIVDTTSIYIPRKRNYNNIRNVLLAANYSVLTLKYFIFLRQSKRKW